MPLFSSIDCFREKTEAEKSIQKIKDFPLIFLIKNRKKNVLFPLYLGGEKLIPGKKGNFVKKAWG